MIHVFIVGSKGIPAKYGGFETFVENLTARKENKDIYYHVSCMNNEEKHFEYNGADCFNVRLPMEGAKGRILHVSRVLSEIERWKNDNKDARTIVYILGCRIGPLLFLHAKIMRKLGIKIMVNPDGLEWKRDKWNTLEKRFLKYCERCLVIDADIVICDSLNIEKYIRGTYQSKVMNTTYIAYGADFIPSKCSDEILEEWLSKNQIIKNSYYLIVGRFVPENNYETMITEFMNSNTNKQLVIITNIEKNKFYAYLKKKTDFDKDNRIKFVGTIYNRELLKKVRENAFAYLHGHEVGGTNPSLLEALASTRVNLLLDVEFNREVAGDGALYWNKAGHSLSMLIQKVDCMEDKMRLQYNSKAKKQVELKYSWNLIITQYEKLFFDIFEP